MKLKTTKVTVTDVLQGNTFKVAPQWMSADNMNGEIVCINGYNCPAQGQPGFDEARQQLEDLILGKEIELTNPVKTTKGQLVCDVLVGGENITTHFTR
jgi:hypothetical protein